MTINSVLPPIKYAEDGVTTEFAVPFRWLAATDLRVTRVDADGGETLLVLNVDYSLTGTDDPDGGSLTTVAASDDTDLVIDRLTSLDQEMHYSNGDGFPAASHERAIDKLTAIAQDQDALNQRQLTAPAGDEANLELPGTDQRIGKFLGFDADGSPVALSGTGNDSALRTDLAALTGAQLIGFRNIGTGAIARSVATRLREKISVADFGAIGDGVSDDTVALARAYSAARSNDIGTVAFGAGTFLTSAEIDTTDIATLGEGFGLSQIKATAAIRSVFKLTGQHNLIEGVWANANGIADRSIYGTACNGSVITRCKMDGAKLDLIDLTNSGNNSNVEISGNLLGNAAAFGTVYSTGTASNGANSDEITISGAANLTSLGIRLRRDYIKVSTGDIHMIIAVTATKITVFPPIVPAHSGVSYSIRKGSCVALPSHGDNSAIRIIGNALQGAPVAAIQDQGLYGAKSQFNIIEACEAGRIIGIYDGANYGAADICNYYETTPSGNIRIENAGDLTVISPLGGIDGIRVADPARLGDATFILQGKLFSIRQYAVQNVGTLNALFGQNYLYETAAGDVTINLPVPTTDTPAYMLYTLFAEPIVVTCRIMNGHDAIFKSSVNVNGVAGATGVTRSGDYVEYLCRWHKDLGWSVTGGTPAP